MLIYFPLENLGDFIDIELHIHDLLVVNLLMAMKSLFDFMLLNNLLI